MFPPIASVPGQLASDYPREHLRADGSKDVCVPCVDLEIEQRPSPIRNLIERPRAERERHAALRYELIGQHWRTRTVHVGEQQSRAAVFDRPVRDFAYLEMGIDLRVDGMKLACATQRVDESGKDEGGNLLALCRRQRRKSHGKERAAGSLLIARTQLSAVRERDPTPNGKAEAKSLALLV